MEPPRPTPFEAITIGLAGGVQLLVVGEGAEALATRVTERVPTLRSMRLDEIVPASAPPVGGPAPRVLLLLGDDPAAALARGRAALPSAAEVRAVAPLGPLALRERADLLAASDAAGLRTFTISSATGRWRAVQSSEAPDRLRPAESADGLIALDAGRSLAICAVVPGGGLGGALRSHAEMTEDLIAQGHMVHTLVPGPDRRLVAELERVGSTAETIHPLPWWISMSADDAAAMVSGRPPDGLVDHDLVRAIQSTAPDVIITQSAVIGQGAVAAAMLDLPHVWILRETGDPAYRQHLPLPRSAFGGLIAALSHAVITTSAFVRDAYFPGDPAAATVIPPRPRMARTRSSAAPAADERPERPWTLGIVGSVTPGKGHAHVIDAIAALRQEGQEVPLVCVGVDPGADEDVARLLAHASGAGVEDLVRLEPAVDDREQVYARMDAVVIPSAGEGFGRIPFEATAAGLPVIYAAGGAHLEFMKPDVTGIAFMPGDATGITRAIARLRSDPSTGPSLVRSARDALRAIADDDRPVHLLEDVLRAAAREETTARGADDGPRALVGWMSRAIDRSTRLALDLEVERYAVVVRHRAVTSRRSVSLALRGADVAGRLLALARRRGRPSPPSIGERGPIEDAISAAREALAAGRPMVADEMIRAARRQHPTSAALAIAWAELATDDGRWTEATERWRWVADLIGPDLPAAARAKRETAFQNDVRR